MRVSAEIEFGTRSERVHQWLTLLRTTWLACLPLLRSGGFTGISMIRAFNEDNIGSFTTTLSAAHHEICFGHADHLMLFLQRLVFLAHYSKRPVTNEKNTTNTTFGPEAYRTGSVKK